MKETPKVTIVTPSYNQAPYLEATLLSVLKQDYPNIEYIVIDGGSTDGSVDIIKKYESQLSFWVSEPDSGQCEAINKGFAQATGDIFNWVNSDDQLMPAATRVAVFCLQQPEVGAVYGDNIVVDQTGNILKPQLLPPYWQAALPYHHRIPQETFFAKRQYWEQVNGLNEDYHFNLDVELFLRLSKVTTFQHIPLIMGAARQHPDCKTYQVRHENPNAHPEMVRAFEEHCGHKPSPFMRKYYKNINKLRLALYLSSRARRKEVRELLRFVASPLPETSNYHIRPI